LINEKFCGISKHLRVNTLLTEGVMKYKILAGLLIDSKQHFLRKNVNISIENEKISEIYDDSNLNKKNYDERKLEFKIDATKFTVLPGLIDSHVHIMMNPKYKNWHSWLDEEKELILLKSAKNLSQLIKNGVTTIRDCGAYKNVSHILREAVEKKYIDGPRLIISGNPLTITGGHCYYMGIEADSIDELRKAVRRLNKENVDFIKIMATGGSLTPQSNRRGTQYNYNEIRTVVEEAHLRGKKVAAHALCTKGIIDSVNAGVDTIEHCAWLNSEKGFIYDNEIVKKMVDNNIYVNPSLPATARYLSRVLPEEKEYLFKNRIKLLRNVFDSGVKILAGTDAGVPEVGFNDLVYSIKLLSEYIGLSKIQSIFAATINNACALGIGDITGSIEEGKLADIVVVDGNPLENLDALEKVVMVIKNGEILFRDSSKI